MTSSTADDPTGSIVRVAGPLVEVGGLNASMFDVVLVGPNRLPGEAVLIDAGRTAIQVYEYTGGLRPGDEATGTEAPLSVELGPDLLGGVFDGLLRDLSGAPALLEPGKVTSGLPHTKEWPFSPAVEEGEAIRSGIELGSIEDVGLTGGVPFRVIVPPGVTGTLEWIAPAGAYRSDACIAVVDGTEVTMSHRWPIRHPRPAKRRLDATVPLVTGQRVLDMLFPIAKGGTAAVPGGFGTGKTVMLQQIAKWSDADVIVYVGCGERGNEMADVAHDLAEIENPRTGRSLLERVVLIANTSNMPVMAREASIYMGATVAEYFRDMGLDAVVIADSTSRWAEAMREVSSAMRQLPAEEGYPATLASALAAFYERAGRFETIGGREGSVTVIGAVSPAGGDMTEPVTAHTRRFVRAVWSLDRELAYARHYPAVSWRDSFSRDVASIAGATIGSWLEQRDRAVSLLAEADRLESVVALVGAAALPDLERVTLLVARLLREGVLQQNALVENDARSSPEKAAALMDMAFTIHDVCLDLLDHNVPAAVLEEFDLSRAYRAREETSSDDVVAIEGIRDELVERLRELA